MRILTITSHISSNALPCFQRNKTGFGYMVHDIITTLADKVDMDVLVYYYRFQELWLEGARFLGISLFKILSHLHQVLSPLVFVNLCRKYTISTGAMARLFYAWSLTGYVHYIIQKGQYDVVHIHGCSIINELWIHLCKKMGQKYVVTLHGLNSFSDSIRISEGEWKHEKDFLREVVEGFHNVTVIASGIKKKVLECENVQRANNIKVVCNAFHFENTNSGVLDIRSLYKIPATAKVILYVGNVSYNKNQRQMINAFPLINREISESTYVLFIGNHAIGEDDIRPLVSKSNYKEHLICCGMVDKQYMPDFFKSASAVVLLSISEGFGLSLIEGMHFGLPCATFTDLDAYDDIYNPCAMVGIARRSDEDVAKAIETIFTTSWDKQAIVSYSKKFESETMADNYIKTFHDFK